MKVRKGNSAAVVAALSKRFHAPAWALLEQVADGTGYGISRFADAVAMSLWPSRGLDLHGIEIKVSRGDWLREMKRPDKAEPIAGYCDFWWLATTPDVVDLERDPIPQPWGLLVLTGRGLVQHREAARNPSPAPLDKSLLAAILRRSTEAMVPRSAIAAKLEAAKEEGREAGKQASTFDASELRDLRASVDAFTRTSGIDLGRFNGESLGQLVEAARKIQATRERWVMAQARGSLEAALKRVDEAERILNGIAPGVPE